MPITKASGNSVTAAAKGDLVVGNATNDSGVLSVGANDTVLTADSSAATGVKWATPAAGGMTLLSTTTLSGTTTTISSIDQGYTNLIVIMRGASINASEAVQIRPNNVQSSGLYTGILGGAADSPGQITINPFPTSANSGNTFVISINQYASTTNSKPTQWFGTTNQSTASTYNFAGVINTNSAITSMVFFAQDSKTFSGGTVLIYGVK